MDSLVLAILVGQALWNTLVMLWILNHKGEHHTHPQQVPWSELPEDLRRMAEGKS